MSNLGLDEEFTRTVLEGLVPKLRESVITMALVDGTIDVEYAVQLGLMILMDKPILTLVLPGQKVSDHLRRVSDRVVEIDIADPTQKERLQAEIQSFAEEFAPMEGEADEGQVDG